MKTTLRHTTYLTAYKFNGKEMDAETGLYYYGARYYEPELAMWYGVDALAEKYANMGAYVYCAGNPVKLVDVDGNGWYSVTDENGNVTYHYSKKIYSQKDLETEGIKGKYMGIRMLINKSGKPDLKGENYYSLWGEKHNIREPEGAVIKAIDDGLINKMNEEIETDVFKSNLNNYGIETSDVIDSYKIDMKGLVPKAKGIVKYAGADNGWYDNYSSSKNGYLTNTLEKKTTIGSDYFSMTKNLTFHLTLRNVNDTRSGAILVDLQFNNKQDFDKHYNAIKKSIINRRCSR